MEALTRIEIFKERTKNKKEYRCTLWQEGSGFAVKLTWTHDWVFFSDFFSSLIFLDYVSDLVSGSEKKTQHWTTIVLFKIFKRNLSKRWKKIKLISNSHSYNEGVQNWQINWHESFAYLYMLIFFSGFFSFVQL